MESHDERRTFGSGAVRDGGKKPAMELISPHMMNRLGEWLRFACEDRKPEPYTPRNWEKGMPFSATIGSLQRHVEKFKLGSTTEDHLAAIVFGAMALMHYQEEIKAGRLPAELDDMPHYPSKATRLEEITAERLGKVDWDKIREDVVKEADAESEVAYRRRNLCLRVSQGDDLHDWEKEELQGLMDPEQFEVQDPTPIQSRLLGMLSATEATTALVTIPPGTPLNPDKEMTLGVKVEEKKTFNGSSTLEGRAMRKIMETPDGAVVPLTNEEMKWYVEGREWHIEGIAAMTEPPTVEERVMRKTLATPNEVATLDREEQEFVNKHPGKLYKPFTVYLCGPIGGRLSDHEWRNNVSSKLSQFGIKTLDPLRGKRADLISDQGLGYNGVLAPAETADRDKADIDEADMVLACFPYAPKRQSIGSSMEMGMAVWANKPVVLCAKPAEFNKHLFCRRFCTIVPDLAEAVRQIRLYARNREGER